MNAQETAEIRDLTEDDLNTVAGAATLKEEISQTFDSAELRQVVGDLSQPVPCIPSDPKFCPGPRW